MSTDLPEMPFLGNIGLLVTYKCQVACPHCIIEAGPHRTEEMAIDDTLDWIRQIADYHEGRVKVLSLTGGEPFYDLGTLKTISDHGAAQGLLVSAVTNAYWASSRKQAVSILRALPSLRFLSFSADVYHQIHIPFERVRNAILAAEECGVPYSIAACTENETDDGYRAIVDRLHEITDDERILTAITFRAGRALKKSGGKSRYETSDDPPRSACAAGASPIIFPDGRVMACIGPVIDLKSSHPLVLGDLRRESLAEILDRAQHNVVLHAIRIWGPRKLIAELEAGGLGGHLPETYVKDSVCHACYDLMADGAITDFLSQLAQQPDFSHKVAYGRLYFMNEPEMLTALGLAEQGRSSVATAAALA